MKKTIILFFLIVISIVGYFLNENAKQVQAWVHERIYISTNLISESKYLGVFEKELIVDKIVFNDKNMNISIDQAWIEKERFKARKETYIEEGDYIAVFKISRNSKVPYLKDSVNFTWGISLNQKNTPTEKEYLNKKYPHQYYGVEYKNGVAFDFIEGYDTKDTTYRFDILRNESNFEGKGRKVVGYIILSAKN
jgi:hypothetical protein